MKVFTQLMMKRYNVKYYMNLTTVGSPTISSGVVSGFSVDDYIADNNTFDINSNFEINVKINYWENTGSTQYFISLRGNKNFNLYFGATGSSISEYNGSSYWNNLANNLEIGVPITVKIKGNGTNITITVNQNSYTNTNSKTITELGLSGNFIIHFGKGNTALPFTSGIIDFNNSYEISNGTKYIFTLPQ